MQLGPAWEGVAQLPGLSVCQECLGMFLSNKVNRNLWDAAFHLKEKAGMGGRDLTDLAKVLDLQLPEMGDLALIRLKEQGPPLNCFHISNPS